MLANACCWKHDWLIEEKTIDVNQTGGISNIGLVHQKVRQLFLGE
jgi:hypothetical protein